MNNQSLHLVLALSFLAVTGLLTSCVQGNDGSESRTGELARIYLEYLEGMKTRNLAQLRTLSAVERQEWIHRLETMSQDKRDTVWQAMAHMSMKGKDFRVAKEVIEGNRGILRAEWFGPSGIGVDVDRMVSPSESLRKVERKQIQTRQYVTVFFVKEGDAWKFLKSSQVSYHDPRPLFTIVDEKSDSLWSPQYHCAFLSSAAVCSDTTRNQDACWGCFAKLNADLALCDNLAHDMEVQDSALFHNHIASMRENCKAEVAELTGDASVCTTLKDEEIVGINPQQRCLDGLKDVGFLSSININTLDSDSDGLTDLQEIYFDTSIASSDTDNDGQSDFDEVTAMSNPLGAGKLGDHLK